MRLSTTTISTLSTVLLILVFPQIPLVSASASSPASIPASQDTISNQTPVPTPTSSASQLPSYTHKLDLRDPQAGVGAAAGGTAPALPDPTQMSPITTYLIHGVDGNKSPVPYTQLFSAVPDQWPAPTQGVIGLGSISGTVGAVKTVSKRGEGEDPLQTRAVGMGMGMGMGRIGIGKVLERRKSKSGSSGGGAGSSGAGNTRVEFGMLAWGVGLAFGVLGVGIGL